MYACTGCGAQNEFSAFKSAPKYSNDEALIRLTIRAPLSLRPSATLTVCPSNFHFDVIHYLVLLLMSSQHFSPTCSCLPLTRRAVNAPVRQSVAPAVQRSKKGGFIFVAFVLAFVHLSTCRYLIAFTLQLLYFWFPTNFYLNFFSPNTTQFHPFLH